MQNPVDWQPVLPVIADAPSVPATEGQNDISAGVRRPFVEPSVSAATDVLEVTQNFAQVSGSGIIP